MKQHGNKKTSVESAALCQFGARMKQAEWIDGKLATPCRRAATFFADREWIITHGADEDPIWIRNLMTWRACGEHSLDGDVPMYQRKPKKR